MHTQIHIHNTKHTSVRTHAQAESHIHNWSWSFLILVITSRNMFYKILLKALARQQCSLPHTNRQTDTHAHAQSQVSLGTFLLISKYSAPLIFLEAIFEADYGHQTNCPAWTYNEESLTFELMQLTPQLSQT